MRGDLGGWELTPREVEVLELIAEGHRNAEIAKILFLGTETIKSHVQSILWKTNSRTRSHAVHQAHLQGWFGIHVPSAWSNPSPPRMFPPGSAPCS